MLRRARLHAGSRPAERGCPPRPDRGATSGQPPTSGARRGVSLETMSCQRTIPRAPSPLVCGSMLKSPSCHRVPLCTLGQAPAVVQSHGMKCRHVSVHGKSRRGALAPLAPPPRGARDLRDRLPGCPVPWRRSRGHHARRHHPVVRAGFDRSRRRALGLLSTRRRSRRIHRCPGGARDGAAGVPRAHDRFTPRGRHRDARSDGRGVPATVERGLLHCHRS